MMTGLAWSWRILFLRATEIRNVGWADRTQGLPPGQQETGLSLGLFSLPPFPRPPHVTVAVARPCPLEAPAASLPWASLIFRLPLALNKHFPAIFP